jgi:hypothetical protein
MNDVDREKRIRKAAHDLWVAEGYPQGQDDRHWRMATQIVKEEDERRTPPPVDKPLEKKKPNENT